MSGWDETPTQQKSSLPPAGEETRCWQQRLQCEPVWSLQATEGTRARPAREEADALPTFQAQRPPAPHTGAPSSPQGAVLDLSLCCAHCAGPRGVLPSPAVSTRGRTHPHRPSTSVKVQPDQGPFCPQSGSPLGCRSRSAFRNPWGTALPVAAVGSHVSRALRRRTCDAPTWSWGPLHPCDVPSGDGPCRSHTQCLAAEEGEGPGHEGLTANRLPWGRC